MLLALTNDLMAAAPIEHAARQAGTQCRVIDPAQLDEVPSDQEVRLVVIDLGAVSGVAETVTALRGRLGESLAILAFGPHVQTEKLTAARQAGCTQVLTQGQFHQSAVAIIAEAVASQ